MFYQEMVNQVKEPWRQFLKRTELLSPVNETMTLIVPVGEYNMYSSLELLSIVYSIAKSMYPEGKDLAIVCGDEYDLIKDGTLELVDIRYT